MKFFVASLLALVASASAQGPLSCYTVRAPWFVPNAGIPAFIAPVIESRYSRGVDVMQKGFKFNVTVSNDEDIKTFIRDGPSVNFQLKDAFFNDEGVTVSMIGEIRNNPVETTFRTCGCTESPQIGFCDRILRKRVEERYAMVVEIVKSKFNQKVVLENGCPTVRKPWVYPNDGIQKAIAKLLKKRYQRGADVFRKGFGFVLEVQNEVDTVSETFNLNLNDASVRFDLKDAIFDIKGEAVRVSLKAEIGNSNVDTHLRICDCVEEPKVNFCDSKLIDQINERLDQVVEIVREKFPGEN